MTANESQTRAKKAFPVGLINIFDVVGMFLGFIAGLCVFGLIIGGISIVINSTNTKASKEMTVPVFAIAFILGPIAGVALPIFIIGKIPAICPKCGGYIFRRWTAQGRSFECGECKTLIKKEISPGTVIGTIIICFSLAMVVYVAMFAIGLL